MKEVLERSRLSNVAAPYWLPIACGRSYCVLAFLLRAGVPIAGGRSCCQRGVENTRDKLNIYFNNIRSIALVKEIHHTEESNGFAFEQTLTQRLVKHQPFNKCAQFVLGEH